MEFKLAQVRGLLLLAERQSARVRQYNETFFAFPRNDLL